VNQCLEMICADVLAGANLEGGDLIRFRLLATVFQGGCYPFRGGGRQRLQLILRSLLVALRHLSQSLGTLPAIRPTYLWTTLLSCLPSWIISLPLCPAESEPILPK
jgi:hypothetical protein